MKHAEEQATFDYIVLGAGPAGVQMGYCLEQAGHSYTLLEGGDSPGTFYKTFPRHRTLISSNKVYTGFDDPEMNMRWDWNSLVSDSPEMLFKNYSTRYFPPADDLVRYLGDFVRHFGIRVRYNTRVARVTKVDGEFVLTDTEGNTYRAKRVVVATGYSRPYQPEIPGFELTESYNEVSVDPADFINQHVLIVGKGNSAFETADNLIPTAAVIHVISPSPVNLAWKTHFVGHLRAVNNNFLDTYQLKSQNAILDATIEKIEKRDGRYVVSVSYTHANGEREELFYDRVISCTGFRFDASIFDETCTPELAIKDRFPRQTSAWESTNVPGLYFAGSLMHMRDFKKHTSGFIHGFRYNVVALHRILEARYHARPLPRRSIEATVEGLTEAVVARVNRSSALWQQFGFLGDALVVAEDGTAEHFEELPVDYIHDGEIGRSAHYYVVTLEFGKIVGDPFAVERNPDPDYASRSTFLHPVVRRYRGITLLSEVHMIEDLYADWTKEEMHLVPLRAFFEASMAAEESALVGA
ncbi:MAG: NAD(P)-binding domain-containing protein [Gemmatimonadetes bacterium]|nr:NAD(P)-binding domain-containing protein [Gemmatimonadota bacterium]